MNAPVDPTICTVDEGPTTTSSAIARAASDARGARAEHRFGYHLSLVLRRKAAHRSSYRRTRERRSERQAALAPFRAQPAHAGRGMDRREYRSAKFGSWAHSQSLDAQVAAEGAREGIVFRHDLMIPHPQRPRIAWLVWLAGELGDSEVQNRVVEELFAASSLKGEMSATRRCCSTSGCWPACSQTR